MKYVIGIDIGTSGTKTVLLPRRRRRWRRAPRISIIPTSKRLRRAGTGRLVESDGRHHSGSARQSGAGGGDRGIGLSGQMHGLVMLDKDGEVLRRSIIWCDQRTAAECEEITRKVARAGLSKSPRTRR